MTVENSGTLQLGTLTVHRLGFGSMQLPGTGVWGPPKDHDGAMAVLRRAVELGVDLIDTADSYGPNVAEELIREALHPYPAGTQDCHQGRAHPSGAGPVGRLWATRLPAPAVRRQPASARAWSGSISSSCTGLIPRCRPMSNSGCSESCATRERWPKSDCPRSASPRSKPPCGSSLSSVCRISTTSRNEVPKTSSISASSIRSGSSRGSRWRAASSSSQAGRSTRSPSELGATVSQVSLAWLLRRSPVMLPIPGTSSLAHLEENCAAAAISLTDAQFEELTDARKKLRRWALRDAERRGDS